MSHIATIATQITDIEAVRHACAELGLTFVENQKTCAFWPSSGKPQLHPCDHAVTLPVGQFKMELGLVRDKAGCYSLVGDDMLHLNDRSTCQMIFGRDTNPLGTKFNKLMQLYAVHKTQIEAKRKGWIVTRKVVAGSNKIQLSISGM
jgi:hypothetical protein